MTDLPDDLPDEVANWLSVTNDQVADPAPPPDWHMPVDEPILAALPPEGSRLGYHVLGSTVKMILEQMNEGVEEDAKMTAGIVAQRITRWLRPNGMVVEVKVHGAGGSKGYQITQAGQDLLAAIRGANQ